MIQSSSIQISTDDDDVDDDDDDDEDDDVNDDDDVRGVAFVTFLTRSQKWTFLVDLLFSCHSPESAHFFSFNKNNFNFERLRQNRFYPQPRLVRHLDRVPA